MTIPTHLIISMVTGLVPIIAGVYVARKLSRDMLILLLYCTVAMLIELGMFALALQRINNLWLTHVFTPIQFILLMWVLSAWHRASLRRTLRWVIPVFLVIWLAAFLFVEDTRQFNTITRPVESTLLAIVSAHTLFEVGDKHVDSLLREPSFWVASAVLIYFSTSVLVFALSNIFLTTSHGALSTAYSFKSVINIIANFLYAGGFLCLRRR